MNEVIAFREPRSLAGLAAKLPAVFLPDEKASEWFFGFFTAHIRNRNTRRAYYKAACRFSDWCEGRELKDLANVKPPHVAAYIEILGLAVPEGQGLSKPSVKQHLAALLMLFDWLVVGHVLDVNPAHAVRGPKSQYIVFKLVLLTALLLVTAKLVSLAQLLELFFRR